jgi:hypothetical protein
MRLRFLLLTLLAFYSACTIGCASALKSRHLLTRLDVSGNITIYPPVIKISQIGMINYRNFKEKEKELETLIAGEQQEILSKKVAGQVSIKAADPEDVKRTLRGLLPWLELKKPLAAHPDVDSLLAMFQGDEVVVLSMVKGYTRSYLSLVLWEVFNAVCFNIPSAFTSSSEFYVLIIDIPTRHWLYYDKNLDNLSPVQAENLKFQTEVVMWDL